MKIKSFILKQITVCLFSVLSITLMSSCQKDSANINTSSATNTFAGNADGAQMLPPTTTTARGTFTGTYNSSTNTLSYTSTWTGLTSAPTAAGFYEGATGTTGTFITNFGVFNGSTNSGTTTGTLMLNADQASQLFSGRWYYVYTTPAFTSGEIRGQITKQVTK